MSASVQDPPAPRRWYVTALVVLASVLTFLALFATWIDQQVFDTDEWTETSTELLADDEIRNALSVYLTDELFKNVDVVAELEALLPPRGRSPRRPGGGSPARARAACRQPVAGEPAGPGRLGGGEPARAHAVSRRDRGPWRRRLDRRRRRHARPGPARPEPQRPPRHQRQARREDTSRHSSARDHEIRSAQLRAGRGEADQRDCDPVPLRVARHLRARGLSLSGAPARDDSRGCLGLHHRGRCSPAAARSCRRRRGRRRSPRPPPSSPLCTTSGRSPPRWRPRWPSP